MESQLRETLRNLDYRTFMDTLFDARSHIHSDWKKDDWICRNCLSSLWIDALDIWWLELKRKGRQFLFFGQEFKLSTIDRSSWGKDREKLYVSKIHISDLPSY